MQRILPRIAERDGTPRVAFDAARHLASCVDCAAELLRLRELNGLLDRMPFAEVPDSFPKRVLRALRTKGGAGAILVALLALGTGGGAMTFGGGSGSILTLLAGPVAGGDGNPRGARPRRPLPALRPAGKPRGRGLRRAAGGRRRIAGAPLGAGAGPSRRRRLRRVVGGLRLRRAAVPARAAPRGQDRRLAPRRPGASPPSARALPVPPCEIRDKPLFFSQIRPIPVSLTPFTAKSIFDLRSAIDASSAARRSR